MPAHLQAATPAVDRSVAPGSKSQIRVVLADNHAVMRHSLHLLLDGEADIRVVADTGDLASVVRHLHDLHPDVLVLDLGMQNGSSIEVIRHLRERASSPGIVVLTMEDNPAFARRAIHAGAAGCVIKDRADGELPAAVRGAATRAGAMSG
jgi:two-component system response regulator NreC